MVAYGSWEGEGGYTGAGGSGRGSPAAGGDQIGKKLLIE